MFTGINLVICLYSALQFSLMGSDHAAMNQSEFCENLHSLQTHRHLKCIHIYYSVNNKSLSKDSLQNLEPRGWRGEKRKNKVIERNNTYLLFFFRFSDTFHDVCVIYECNDELFKASLHFPSASCSELFLVKKGFNNHANTCLYYQPADVALAGYLFYLLLLIYFCRNTGSESEEMAFYTFSK